MKKTTTTKTTIIRDVNKRPLFLTSTELIEGTRGGLDDIRWAAYLRDIDDDEFTNLHDAENAKNHGFVLVRVNFENRTIGCRKFGKKTFDTILAAIKKAKKRK
jgi:hypothetical protein